MKIKLRVCSRDELINSAVYILPICNDALATKIDFNKEIVALIQKIIQQKLYDLKHGDTYIIHHRDKPLIICSVGDCKDITSQKLRQAGGIAYKALTKVKCSKVSIISSLPNEVENTSNTALYYFVEGFMLASYRFETYKKPTEPVDYYPSEILIDDTNIDVKWLNTTISANFTARNLVNIPANDLTPTALAKHAKKFATNKLSVTTLGKREILSLKMGALMAVAQGSHEPPALIVMHHKVDKEAPIAIVGKAITFDSGGLSLKPPDGMEKMKYDMAGGAAVIAIMQALQSAGIQKNVVGLIPAAENMPGGAAIRPGDIIKSMNGKTIEIANTDAEGRLVIVDAITYAVKKFKPSLIIDIATLTGACSITFGNEAIAMMGTCQKTMDELKKASDLTYERVWQMPLYEEYKEYLKSETADIKNIGGRFGSMLTAGYFIKEFTEDVPWVHLDIAATAYADKAKHYIQKGATGVAVRLLLTFLKYFHV